MSFGGLFLGHRRQPAAHIAHRPGHRHATEVAGGRAPDVDRERAVGDRRRLLEIDTSIFLPDDLMIKNDRMSMAHSLELRVPFSDFPEKGLWSWAE